MSYTIKIEGDEQVKLKIDSLKELRGFRRGLRAAGIYVRGFASRYPPQPRRSTYKRTGTLGKKWSWETVENGLSVVIGNTTDYADRVQGESQMSIFRSIGWLSVDVITDRTASNVFSLINDEIQKEVQS